jgi:hypothetical protein
LHRERVLRAVEGPLEVVDGHRARGVGRRLVAGVQALEDVLDGGQTHVRRLATDLRNGEEEARG